MALRARPRQLPARALAGSDAQVVIADMRGTQIAGRHMAARADAEARFAE